MQCFQIRFSHQNNVFHSSPQIRLLSRQGGKTVELENKQEVKVRPCLSSLFTFLLPGISQSSWSQTVVWLVNTITANKTALLVRAAKWSQTALQSSDIHHGLVLFFLFLVIWFFYLQIEWLCADTEYQCKKVFSSADNPRQKLPKTLDRIAASIIADILEILNLRKGGLSKVYPFCYIRI